MRRFEFSEGGSKKFWEITVEGATFTVRFGRIGTDGQGKTTTCASPDEAVAESAKLIREKMKKGYQEIGAATVNWRPPKPISRDTHVERFLNFAVCGFNPDADADSGEDEDGGRSYPSLRDLERRVFSIRTSYEGEEGDFLKHLQALIDDPKAGQLKALVLGAWFTEVCEEGPEEAMRLLIANRAKLGSLAGIFIGDVLAEETEISWLHQGDCAPLIHAFPGLQEFVVRGADGLRFSALKHAGLRSLTVQCGGLSAECVRDIAAADLPELRNLTLWLGSDNYGGNATVADLKPILDGAVFPKLEYLGLMDAQEQDAIAAGVAQAPIVSRLKGLDLSMGTLTDAGGLALLQSPALRSLTYLNLRHHWMSEKVQAQFRKLGIEVDVSDAQSADEDEDYRYCEVAE